MASRGNAAVTLNWNDRQLLDLTEKAMAAGLRAAAKHGRKAIKFELAGAPNQAKGLPPGKVSGNLQKAVGYRVKKRQGKYVVVDVGVLKPSPYDSRAAGRSFPGRMHAQAVRLFRGFTKKDRLGRTYSQAPRPVVEQVLVRERSAMAQLVQDTASTWMPKARRSTR